MKALIMAVFFTAISANCAFAAIPGKLIGDMIIIFLCIAVVLAVIISLFFYKRKKFFSEIHRVEIPQQAKTTNRRCTTQPTEYIDFLFEDLETSVVKKYRLYFSQFIKWAGTAKDGKPNYLTFFSKPKKANGSGNKNGEVELNFMRGTEKSLRGQIQRIIRLVTGPGKPGFEALRLLRMTEITDFIKTGKIKPLVLGS